MVFAKVSKRKTGVYLAKNMQSQGAVSGIHEEEAVLKRELGSKQRGLELQAELTPYLVKRRRWAFVQCLNSRKVYVIIS